MWRKLTIGYCNRKQLSPQHNPLSELEYSAHSIPNLGSSSIGLKHCERGWRVRRWQVQVSKVRTHINSYFRNGLSKEKNLNFSWRGKHLNWSLGCSVSTIATLP